AQKAPKVWRQLQKWGKDMDLEHWNFLSEFVELQKKIKAKGKVKDDKSEKIAPDYTYIKDLVGGRPVLGHPLREGTLRLRYGRARVSGLSSSAIHPATQVVLNGYIAIGTHIKTERPMKGSVLALCDTIEGPIVKLKNGNVVKLDNFEKAKNYVKDIIEVLYLGDILINYELFLNRAHKLVPAGFCPEWWVYYVDKEKASDKELVEKLIRDPLQTKITFEQAEKISQETGAPLHPDYIFFWNAIQPKDFLNFFNHIKNASIQPNKIIVPWDDEVKRSLELIGIPHTAVMNEYVVIEEPYNKALLANIGNFERFPSLLDSPLDMVNQVSKYKIMDKLGTFIGSRMGRPEKAKMRKLTGSPQVLFPVGEEGGRLRCFQSALEAGKVTAEFPIYFCDKCNRNTIYKVCEVCGNKTQKRYYCRQCKKEIESEECPKHGPDSVIPYKRQEIDIRHYYEHALRLVGERSGPPLVKGVRGTTNIDHIPEHLAKGILRAKYEIYVNKEGTTRYDMTEMACTHFKPAEVGTSIEKLKELGYTHDIYGEELKDDNQIIELKPQDFILPACDEAMEEGADKVFLRVGKFIDEMLEKLYGMKAFYNFNKPEDIIGHLFVSLSPHTSAGVIIRAIGFSKTQGFLAHPLLHCLMRRDCDSDEAGVMLLLDALINFSRGYLPNTRGITQDTPLVLTSTLLPSEVDDQILDMDVCWRYPLELYESALEYKQPWEVDIETYSKRLGKEEQYEGLGFTHHTSDLNNGIRCSAYKSLPSMEDKVKGQMDIAAKLRAVDTDDVAKLVIERHFIRDIKGNLRKFSMQQFRCVKCNEKFR
ncbi:MAG: DNA polymerase II large subunit, partial [Spirochaetes bacterium]